MTDAIKEWWGDTLKRRLTLVTAFITTLLAVLHFGSVAEPYWIVHRQFARDLVAASEKAAIDRERVASERDSVQMGRILSTEIAIKESDLRSIQRDIDRARTELQKLPPTAPESLRDLLNDQVRRYIEQISALNRELDDLLRQRSGRRP